MRWLFVLLFLGIVACSKPTYLPTVENVDLERYQGRWYEIARLPLRAQRNCTDTYAEYKLHSDGYVEVFNACIDSVKGETITIKGKARPTGRDNSRLTVSFFWPIKAPYHLLALDTVAYQYALVGSPNRRYLWLLSRQTTMPDSLYRHWVAYADSLGFPTEKLLPTTQHGTAHP